ncbi:MAG: mercury resistance system periplasmic binding protein MerP [Burkholderiales bacterium]|nr:mercury resistance system periplasmic binding protein MerP [Burkholderiales bacterium]
MLQRLRIKVGLELPTADVPAFQLELNKVRARRAILLKVALDAAPLQTAALEVQNMTCGLCPVTVKKSLERVAGVRQARMDFAKKTAIVTFDADKTNATALVKATTDAGYPSTVHK